MKPHIRWMIRRDMAEVLEIENAGFEFPWSDEDFTRCLRHRNVIGQVAVHDDQVVGMMVYQLHKHHLHILNFAVGPQWQRQGVGRAMIRRLESKLSHERRTRLVLEIRETNVAGQLFFQRMGFRAIAVLRDFYDHSPEDAYHFEYRLPDVRVGCVAWYRDGIHGGHVWGLAKQYQAETAHELINAMGADVARYFGVGVEMVFEDHTRVRIEGAENH